MAASLFCAIVLTHCIQVVRVRNAQSGRGPTVVDLGWRVHTFLGVVGLWPSRNGDVYIVH